MQAILYAAVLRARYDGVQFFTDEAVVRSHAEAYIQAMLIRTKTHQLPTLQVDSAQAMTSAMSHYLYSVGIHIYIITFFFL